MSSPLPDSRIVNQHQPGKKPVGASSSVVSNLLNRVCIQCNNMFQVTPNKFDAKQCPSCHKG